MCVCVYVCAKIENQVVLNLKYFLRRMYVFYVLSYYFKEKYVLGFIQRDLETEAERIYVYLLLFLQNIFHVYGSNPEKYENCCWQKNKCNQYLILKNVLKKVLTAHKYFKVTSIIVGFCL